jgi:hypothetical protein
MGYFRVYLAERFISAKIADLEIVYRNYECCEFIERIRDRQNFWVLMCYIDEKRFLNFIY